jgi:hypothetical protein
VTREEPALQLITRRAPPVAAAVVSAVISIGTAAPALAGARGQQAQVSVVASGKDAPTTPTDAPGTATLSGKLSDNNGPVSGAGLLLTGCGQRRAGSSSASGEYIFEGLDAGAYTIEVLGASGVVTKSVVLEPAEQKIFDVALGADVGTVVSGAIAVAVPQTLRLLYDASDLIVIGRAVGSAPGRGNEGDEVVTQYRVASVLKGKSRRQQIGVTHYGQTDERFVEGKTALLFLSKGNPENGASRGSYVLADFSNGIKALPQADIDIYLGRIKDLDAIERREHSSADIVEWLVRCAEDPATRWEGAYELANDPADSFDPEQSDGDKPARSIKEPPASDGSDQLRTQPVTADSPNAESVASEDQSDGEEEADSTNESLVPKLTETQKERLVTALLATQTITKGDLELIKLIKIWKEPRLLDFLLARLHGMEDNPPGIADQWVEDLSEMMDARDVSALADQFKDLPSAEDASVENAGDQNDQPQDRAGDQAEKTAKAREAAEKRSAALKAFLAGVERRVRSQTGAP